jgi:peptidoglycan hydrolase CwlO-like protein
MPKDPVQTRQHNNKLCYLHSTQIVLTYRTMQHFPKHLVPALLLAFSFTACGNLSNEVENKLNALKNKTETLDSTINKEFEKVSTLDSLINKESEKVKKLDTLINSTSSRLESISH